jgi:hypothetical protein
VFAWPDDSAAGRSFHRAAIFVGGSRFEQLDARYLDHAEWPWCWLLANVKRLKPILYKGRQKLFDVPWPQ